MPDGSLSTRLERAEDGFNASTDRPKAERDAHLLSLLATRLVGFIDEIEDQADKLDTARDVGGWIGADGPRWSRSKWDRKALAEGFAEAFANNLLSAEAGRLFMAQVELMSGVRKEAA